MPFLSEAAVELALLEQLQELGYTSTSDEAIGPDGKHPERESYNGWSESTLYLQEGTYE